MPRGGGSRRDLPQCYGTRDGACAGQGCMWERGCAAETWTAPREVVGGVRRKVTDVFSSPCVLGSGRGEK